MGRLGGLSAVMSTVAGKLKQDRLAQQETTQKRGLLGFSSLLQGKTELAGPEDTGGIQVPGIGRLKAIKAPSKFGPEALAFEAAKAGIRSPIGTKEFKKDVSIAQSKIAEGADPFQIFQTMSLEYPKASTWLKRQLIEKSSTAQSIEDLIGELK